MFDPNLLQIKVSSEQEHRIVCQNIFKFNQDYVPLPPNTEMFDYLKYCMVGKNQGVVGGISALVIWGHAVNVDILWVADEYRHQGIGTQLLTYLENVCCDNGVKIIQVDTFDFQAVDFYKKHGYSVFGELADALPNGHIRYYLSKKLKQRG